MKKTIAILALFLVGCDEEEHTAYSSRFIETRLDYNHVIIHDNATGCEFLYVDRYKMSGLTAIPGTCRVRHD